jgi:flagellin
MALTVATNTGALMAQAAASSVNKEMEISMERLSTGKRINAAADDAAGVAISARLSSEIRGTNQAIRNAMDAQALIDTAEGAHVEIENILQRMRELAVQSSNDTNDANDRANLQLEMSALVTEIDRISNTTSWAGQNLLDGSDADGKSFHVGSRTNSADIITTVIATTTSSALGVGAVSLGSITAVGAEATSTAGVFTMTANEENSITAGGKTFTAGLSVANGTLNTQLATQTATYSTATTLTAGTSAGAANFVVNGVTISYTSTTTQGDNATAMATAFDAAKQNNLLLSHIDATVATNNVSFTATAANIGANLIAKIQADSDVSSKFTISGGATLTFAAKTTASTTSVVTNVSNSSGANVLAAGAGTLAFTTIDTSNSSSRNNDITVTVDGTRAVFNTYTDGEAKGYAITNDAAGKIGFAHALIQKLEDAGMTGVTTSVDAAGVISFSKGGQAVDVTTATSSRAAIATIDNAIRTIGSSRAALGAVSNRLDNTVSNLTNISTNLQAGRGRIEDADFAAETTNLAKAQILQQASTAMLAQANAAKQNVQSLLQG